MVYFYPQMSAPQHSIKKTNLGHSVIFLREDGIIQLNCGDDVIYDIPQVKENLDCIRKIGNGKKLPVMNIGGKYTNVTKEAREFVAKAEFSIDCISAEGYIVKSIAQRITANFYLRINKPKMPTAFFNDENSAVKWLKKYL
jgi:hypothetical protein